jgi:hypothetical protein
LFVKVGRYVVQNTGVLTIYIFPYPILNEAELTLNDAFN